MLLTDLHARFHIPFRTQGRLEKLDERSPVRRGPIPLINSVKNGPAGEAVGLREWAGGNATSAFIIPSEIFSARRVRWIFFAASFCGRERRFGGQSE